MFALKIIRVNNLIEIKSKLNLFHLEQGLFEEAQDYKIRLFFPHIVN
jgi:hypothetical protein